jgi:tRNA pseudouridine38-40 synthase
MFKKFLKRNLKLLIAYDGAAYQGWQVQAAGRTVQGTIEKTLERILGSPTWVIGAGRTDAGVHALGQVIAFRTAWRHPLADLERGLNALLPADIAVHNLELAEPDFHPRFSAQSRWYRYQIGLWSGHAPLRARFVWELGPRLDLDAMQRAAGHLRGEHDFASFGQPPQGENTIRQVFAADWTQQDDILYFDIRANAFLRHMVRNLVGTLVQVGQHRLTPDEFIYATVGNQLGYRLNEYVLRRVCSQIVKWKERHKNFDWVIAVNISPEQFADPKFEEDLISIIDEYGLEPSLLELEIIEDALLGDMERTIKTIKSLRERGIKFSIDDFGTGYSSLNYLYRLPVDTLKLDKSFICNIFEGENASIVKLIIETARIFGMKTVAEGVEDIKVLKYLQAYGCDQYQGYYYSKPMRPEEIEKLLKG